ncbi:MAG: DUF819 domain-containing protein [Flavobacteriales bacterium]
MLASIFPLTNDAVVIGIMICILGGLFYLNSLNSFKGFFKYVPLLVLCYFVPGILNSLGVVDSESSQLYFVASRYLLPASLVLLCLSIDIKAILALGPKALIMFFTATLGIVIGGPIALSLVGMIEPTVLGGDGPLAFWRGLSSLAGSWIGGSANQTAMIELADVDEGQLPAMILVDVLIANVWMAFLLVGAGMSGKIDKLLKADNSAIAALQSKAEQYQKSINRNPSFLDLMIILSIAFGGVAVAHLVADGVSPALTGFFDRALEENPDSLLRYLSSLGGSFFWLIMTATIFGVLLSFTKAKTYEGAGASKIGSVFIYILVTTLGMKMNIGELIHNWAAYWPVMLIGVIWMIIHVILLLVVAFIIKAPFFYVAVGSQANVGGAASAPVVAAAFSPSLAPVGVLLAVLGYAVGTIGAYICMIAMQVVS